MTEADSGKNNNACISSTKTASNHNNDTRTLATMHGVNTSSGATIGFKTESSSSSTSFSGDVISLPTRMVLSATAGMGAAIFCHPLDVIRVQMQTFGYKSTVDAATSIYQRSGLVNGLYSGISAAFLRQWLYGSVRMGLYSYLLEKQQLLNLSQNNKPKNDISFQAKLGMGSISGAIGSFVGTPSEVALVRMSADSKLPVGERRNYTSVQNCLSRIANEEGLAALWRGATPTVARATLLSACQMGVTSQTKGYLIESGYFGPGGQYGNGIPMLFCATLVSSFCANIVANPFDVIKSRLQNMSIPDPSSGQKPMYGGMKDCFIKSLQADGPLVLWRGFVPAFVKLAPYSVISLTLLDKLTRAVTGKDAL
mmetsp:Transcript_7017/g.17304  ORF Transcript_7017/g.17304 Transcript_7017/m.17304 type:complete len:368 (+) Transcript_7017:293-1396(+)